LAAATPEPSFLAVSPDRKYLFAVNELGQYEGKPTGTVSSFTLDPTAGQLTFINRQPSGGGAPCHIVTDAKGQHVLVANYSGGNAAVLPVGPDGRLGERTGFVQHEGRGATKRQSGPNGHSINLDAANKFAIVADLGLDKVFIYRYDAAAGTLTASEPPYVEMAPGAGPRHAVFHPSGRFAYVINEIDSTITPLAYDAAKGQFTKRKSVSTLPEGFQGNNSTAEVVVHPNGKYVYGSNRGHNSIAAFSVNADDGTLNLIGHQTEGVKTPRNFVIDPSGNYLLVGSQSADQVVVFRIDAASGKLTPTGTTIEVGSPVCLRFVKRD
jgi:6-phosphogluconolactonase